MLFSSKSSRWAFFPALELPTEASSNLSTSNSSDHLTNTLCLEDVFCSICARANAGCEGRVEWGGLKLFVLAAKPQRRERRCHSQTLSFVLCCRRAILPKRNQLRIRPMLLSDEQTDSFPFPDGSLDCRLPVRIILGFSKEAGMLEGRLLFISMLTAQAPVQRASLHALTTPASRQRSLSLSSLAFADASLGIKSVQDPVYLLVFFFFISTHLFYTPISTLGLACCSGGIGLPQTVDHHRQTWLRFLFLSFPSML